MSTLALEPPPAVSSADPRFLARLSARFGVAFSIGQVAVMIGMATLVLPRGGSLDDAPLERGRHVLEAESAYRAGNYVFMISGMLLLGFGGAVAVRLRQVDRSGVLATVGVAALTLLALVWPFAAVLHDVALDSAGAGSDLRILAGWDSVAPFSLAFSVFPRLMLVGAIVLGLRLAGTGRWLQRAGVALLPLSLVGSATLLTDDLFPVLALSSLGFELWLGALAWHWLRAEG
jgi:hypothetical protein